MARGRGRFSYSDEVYETRRAAGLAARGHRYGFGYSAGLASSRECCGLGFGPRRARRDVGASASQEVEAFGAPFPTNFAADVAHCHRQHREES